MSRVYSEKTIQISADSVLLEGTLALPEHVKCLVVFAHGSGSSRFSPRNTFVARVLRQANIGTLLMDLLTREEDELSVTRFDIDLLTNRLVLATRWLHEQPETKDLLTGYFGASTGAAAALKVTATSGSNIGVVVSRGGRSDLAEEVLGEVRSPTLLIVGGNDEVVLQLNRAVFAKLTCKKDFKVVPGATHLFEEPGALEEVAQLATVWFQRYLLSGNSLSA